MLTFNKSEFRFLLRNEIDRNGEKSIPLDIHPYARIKFRGSFLDNLLLEGNLLNVPVRGFLKMVRTTKNWYSVLVLSFLLKHSCIAKFRDGNRFVIDPGQRPNYSFIRDMVSDNLDGSGPKVHVVMDGKFGQVLDLNGYKFVIARQFSLHPLYLVFFRRWFSDEDLSGYEVIDVGAYTGDTAIYFASKGARVHAYEPVPDAFAMMQRNISLNGLGNTVLAYNCAITNDPSSAIWVDTDTYEGSSSFAKATSHLQKELKIQVNSITIKDALARCAPQSRKLLKINCEGCEFTIVTATNGELLKEFHKILCFYHSDLTGLPKEALIQVMQENGFEVAVSDNQSLLLASKPET